MTLQKFILLLFSFLALGSSCAGSPVLYNSATQKSLPLEEGVKTLNPSGYYILGETHYQRNVQQVQGEFIEKFVLHHQLSGTFSVAWEFLDFPKQAELELEFKNYSSGALSLEDLLTKILGRAPGDHMLYAPLFEKARDFKGKMVATNAPRSWKSIIVQQGISALSSDKIPANMERGNANYLERFKVALGGHGTPDQIENYFMAQSYTDAVMATSLTNATEGSVTFMVVGSFHSDFDHGLPEYLGKLTNDEITHIRILDVSGLSKEEIREALKPDPKYGDRAPYFILLGM